MQRAPGRRHRRADGLTTDTVLLTADPRGGTATFTKENPLPYSPDLPDQMPPTGFLTAQRRTGEL